MKIINPIYDQAFKYMMDNLIIAKKVLSIILGQQVLSIQSKPHETKTIDKKRDIPRWRGLAVRACNIKPKQTN